MNAIAAGMFPSKMTKVTLERHHDAITGSIALGRVGRASDIAGVSLWLASAVRCGVCESGGADGWMCRLGRG